MSLNSDIRTIITGLYPDATFALLSKFRANEQSFYTEATAMPLIIHDDEIVKDNEVKINNNVMKSHKVLVMFLNKDEQTNTDEQSQAIKDGMEGYADAVAVKIYQLEQVRPAGRQKYKTTPLTHIFNSDLSGIVLDMQVNYNEIINF
jgi:hypothetical protein